MDIPDMDDYGECELCGNLDFLNHCNNCGISMCKNCWGWADGLRCVVCSSNVQYEPVEITDETVS